MTKKQLENFMDKYCPSIWNAYSKRQAVKLTRKQIQKVEDLMREIRELIYNGIGSQTFLDDATNKYMAAVHEALKFVINTLNDTNKDLKLK